MNARKKICLLSILATSLVLTLCGWGVELPENDVGPGTGAGIQQVDPNITIDPVGDIVNAWTQARILLDGQKDVVHSQLADAYTSMPELALSYQVNAEYTAYLERLLLLWPLDPPDYTPWPPVGDPPDCEHMLGDMKYLCECMHGEHDYASCRQALLDSAVAAGADIGEPLIALPNCTELLASYKAALKCQLEILEKDDPTDEDLARLVQCKKDADKAWAAYVLRGCLRIRIVP